MLRGEVLLLMVLGLVGCGSQVGYAPQNSDKIFSGIVNGTNVTKPDSYSQHVVFLQVKMGKNGGGDCTGSIIDSQTILTAAHCVTGATAGVIVFANNVQNHSAVSDDQIRWVDVAAVYPKYVPEKESDTVASASPPAQPAPQQIPTVQEMEQYLDHAGEFDYDVAMVHFEGGLPAGYSPVQLATSDSIVKPGAQLEMIGYGLSQVNAQTQLVDGQTVVTPMPVGSTVGQLRETVVPIGVYDTKVGMILTSGTTTSVCSGDSGGPAFLKDPSTGAIVQVGIADAVANPYCNSVSMHTAIFPYLSWIKETAAKMAAQALQAKNANVATISL